MIDFAKLEKILKENNSFLLTTHVNPDADAIGSEIALYLILKELNKEIYIINRNTTPYNLEFLDVDKKIETYNPEQHDNIINTVDVLVAVDFNRSDRMVLMQHAFNNSQSKKICIDHHQNAEDFVDFLFSDISYSATGQIIYDFIKKTGIVKLTYQTAYPIYAAIMTDTGSFRFERTTPELHKIAAELLELGVNPGEVFDKVYDQSRISKVKLLGIALESLKLYGKENQIAYMKLTGDAFKETGALEEDTDGFVNFSLSVEDVRIGLLFIELKEGFKVSFRSKGVLPINELAGEFGGGGHINAAGARVRNGNLDEYLPKILSKAEEYLSK